MLVHVSTIPLADTAAVTSGGVAVAAKSAQVPVVDQRSDKAMQHNRTAAADKTRHSQGKARQGKTRQDKARQGKTSQNKARNTRQGSTSHEHKTRHEAGSPPPLPFCSNLQSPEFISSPTFNHRNLFLLLPSITRIYFFSNLACSCGSKGSTALKVTWISLTPY